MGVGVGQQHSLTHMIKSFEATFDESEADAVPLVRRVNKHILQIDDAHVVAQTSCKPDKLVAYSRGYDERGTRNRSLKRWWVGRVRGPTNSVIEDNKLVDRGTVGVADVHVGSARWFGVAEFDEGLAQSGAETLLGDAEP